MTKSNVCLRFAENDGARTASDVWARAAHVRAFRTRAWQRPAAPPPPPPPPRPRVPAPPPELLFVQISDRHQVDSLRQASEMYCAARDAFGEGSIGTIEAAIVRADGRKVARISSDGRVWPAEQKPGETPLYDPLQPAVRTKVDRALKVTAEHFGIALSDLLSERRTQPLVRRRQIAMYVARETTGRSLPFIGKHLGGRDHSTILHGVRVVEALIDAGDVETKAAVDAIVSRLTGEVR
jgi:hypothetical protein